METLPASNWQRIIFDPLLKQAGGVDKLMDELREKNFYSNANSFSSKTLLDTRELLKKFKNDIVANAGPRVYTKKQIQAWQFNAPADYLIDYERIANELSYKHPVAVVRRGKTIYNILIHKSIVNKATALNYELASCLKKLTCTCYEVITYPGGGSYKSTNELLGEWLEWVKEVKAAKHTQVFTHELQTVNVSVPL